MPDKKVTELTAIDAVTGPDLVMVVDDPSGVAVSKKATVTQVLVNTAKTNVSNTFVGDQTVDGDLFVTGEVNPVVLAEQKRKIDQLEGRVVGDPVGSRTVMSRSLVSGLSLRHDESLALGRITVGNYDTQTYQPLKLEIESLQVHTGVSPGDRVEHLRVHPTGGVTVGALADHAVDPGVGVLQANGLGSTPLDASKLTGVVEDALLTANVLTHLAGYPGGTANFLRADGTFAPTSGPVPYFDIAEAPIPLDPPIGTSRLYALNVNGFTQVEMTDGLANVVRLASDNVLIAKVAEVNPGIARGAAVYISGAQGANALVKLARANDTATLPCVGVALDGGTNNLFIRVLLVGTLEQLPTGNFSEGDALFVSPDVPGGFTATMPQAPNYAQRVGFVTRAHASAGAILVLTTGVIAPPRHHADTHGVAGTDPVVVTALAGFPGTDTTFLRGDGTFAAPPPPAPTGMQTLRKTTNQTINAGVATYVDIAGLTFPVVAGVAYAFYFYVVFQSAQGNTGHKCSINCPAGTLDFHHLNQTIANGPVGAATWTERHSVTRDDMTLLASTVAAGADLIHILQGRYMCTANGVLAVRFANELATTDIVVQAGSWGWYF